ncbi:MAG: PAS domain-containing protein, partial [Rubrivivax sp.]|nr:PAS domain-containing protein [Rubrivivax sp.]
MRDLASGVGVWDHHTLRIFGLEATAPTPTYDEIVQRWVHADDVPLLRRHHATIHGVKGRGGLRFRIVRPDGALRHIQSLYEAIPAPDGGPGRLIGAIIDDTEVHERLAAQQQATAELDRAVELAGISIWRVDLANRTIRFNDVGARMNGLADGRNDCALDDIRALIHPDDLDAVARGAELALAGDQAVDVVARYRKLGGGWRTLLTRRVAVRDEQGGVVGLTGISLDFSAEAGARRRAQELAAHTQLVAEAMGVGFWRREANDGPAHWDDQMYIIHHRDPALGPPTAASWVDELVHPQDRLRIAEQRRQAQANWDPLTDTIFRAADVGGGERWVRIWTRRVVRDGQRLSFGMHLDVTERHQAT